jgi:hypothetical protein
MGCIKTSKALFFTTSPRSPHKLVPEIQLLINNFDGQKWSGRDGVQRAFADVLSRAETYEGGISKKYSEFSARDRITRSPKALGFVDLSPAIRLTEAGNAFVNGNRPAEIFLRQLLKFQLPSPYHTESCSVKGTFWGRPYLELMRLIRELEFLTPDEFKVFALQLTDYRKFNSIKTKIFSFRAEKERNKGRYKQFIDEVFEDEVKTIYYKEISAGKTKTRESTDDSLRTFIKTQKQNMRDYADACFRYLRFTELFASDGKSIRIAENRIAEIDYILSTVEREPVFVKDVRAFKENLFNPHVPTLYTDNRENLENMIMRLSTFTRRDLSTKTVDELKELRDSIISENRKRVIGKQRELLKSYALYQEVMDTYHEIITDDVYDAPLFLEWNTWRAMEMLNGGEITPNFKVDDFGKPTSTARGNLPDIECDYGDFALSVEVTLQRGQRQYETEGEPVTRHYAQLQQRMGKETYCLFIAERINKATWAHFFGLNQIKNIAAYGGKPRIVPLELEHFMKLIDNSYNNPTTPFPSDVRTFLQTAIDMIDESQNEEDWKAKIHSCVETWMAA